MFRRAAEMACRFANRPEKQNLRAAIARFDNKLPGMVNARGVLEHVDKYISVSGNVPAPYEVAFIRGDGTYAIEVGGLRIDGQARVVGADGLFAAGADAGGISTGGYSSGLAAALVFGRIAAAAAIGRAE